MESNSKGNNTTLHKVNIHSSMKQLGWGELDVRKVSEPTLELKDINPQTASVVLKTIVSTGAGKRKVYYFVEEIYRIRYTTDRVYLLDFDRTMTQIPDLKGNIYTNNKIYLGIVSEQTPLRESADGNIIVPGAVKEEKAVPAEAPAAAKEEKAVPAVNDDIELEGILSKWKFATTKETSYVLLSAPDGFNLGFVFADDPAVLSANENKQVKVSGKYTGRFGNNGAVIVKVVSITVL
jgi:hypothetical protein